MTAITFTGTNPTVNDDEDTWGGILNAGRTQIKADLDMLNSAPTATILGRVTAGTGEVERLTVTQATGMLNAFVADDGVAVGTKGLAPAPAIGNAASGKVLRASGAYGHSGVALGGFVGATGASVGTAFNLSCVRGATGKYALTFGTALPSADYAVFPGVFNAAPVHCVVTSKVVGGFSVEAFSAADPPVDVDPTQFFVRVELLA